MTYGQYLGLCVPQQFCPGYSFAPLLVMAAVVILSLRESQVYIFCEIVYNSTQVLFALPELLRALYEVQPVLPADLSQLAMLATRSFSGGENPSSFNKPPKIFLYTYFF